MKIGPTSPQSQPSPESSTNQDRAVRSDSNERADDVLQLSESVRSRLGNCEDTQLCLRETTTTSIYSEAGVRSGSAASDNGSAGKLDQIRARIAAGFYDQPWVKDITTGRLADELQEPPDSADLLEQHD